MRLVQNVVFPCWLSRGSITAGNMLSSLFLQMEGSEPFLIFYKGPWWLPAAFLAELSRSRLANMSEQVFAVALEGQVNFFEHCLPWNGLTLKGAVETVVGNSIWRAGGYNVF